ncbi:serine acetyltransferase [Prevotella cerevisiae]|uniref:Serine acetyltransferase n=1 Tax=Segatella cerevisiae TaxID=2053716 RepID=A0ABT1BXX5_9BACT|nr:serine acetyltransferase [Segatella cerevisiae]MCO6025932.1 serine acetyltransferase [Segatella cerevisiae]
MIQSKTDLLYFLKKDSEHVNFRVLKILGFSFNICGNYTWKYLKVMRYAEYHKSQSGFIHKLLRIWYILRLNRLSIKTGFQIPPGTCGPGLTIWHFGDIIVNKDVRIGENCTLYPGVLIGQKDKGLVPVIGNNVFIGAGTKIIGDVQIGNNVIIGQNCVVTKSIPDNKVIVVNNNLRFLK